MWDKKEYMKQYLENNKEKIAEHQKRYYEKNKEGWNDKKKMIDKIERERWKQQTPKEQLQNMWAFAQSILNE